MSFINKINFKIFIVYIYINNIYNLIIKIRNFNIRSNPISIFNPCKFLNFIKKIFRITIFTPTKIRTKMNFKIFFIYISVSIILLR